MSFSASVADLVEKSQAPLIACAASWQRVFLGDVAKILNGFPWKSDFFNESEGYPIIRIRNVSSGFADTRYRGPIEGGYWIEDGEIIVGMDGHFNCRIWTGGKALLNQRVCKIAVDERFYSTAFLAKAIPGYLSLINQETHSVTVKHLSSKTLDDLPLPLPPVAEQRRIVARIDRLSARSKRARDEIEIALALARRAKAALLDLAFSGRLGTSHKEATWKQVASGELIHAIHAGKNLRCEERSPREDEKGVVKVSAVTWGSFDPSQAKTFLTDYHPASRDKIRQRDFLFSRANTIELVGACVIVGQTPDNLYLSDKILRLELDDEIKPWLMWYYRSSTGRRQLEAVSSGNQLSMRNISQEGLRSVMVPLPNKMIRAELLHRIEHAFAAIDRLAAEAQSARALLDKLDQAILAKAFRGELVPQDPNDEPASVLLERIRAERAAAPAPRRRSARTKV